jgi:hypothetical protein
VARNIEQRALRWQHSVAVPPVSRWIEGSTRALRDNRVA